MKKIIVLIIVILVIAGAAAALFRSRPDKTTSTTPSTSSSTSQSQSMTDSQTSSTPVSSNDITISNFAFSPNTITVKKGTKVTWTNQDSTPHQPVADNGQEGPSSKVLAKGESYSFTYNNTGTFTYHCGLHSSMTGSVVVTN